MDSIRIGNDISLSWVINRKDGVSVALEDAKDLNFKIIHSTLRDAYEPTVALLGNTLTCRFPASEQRSVGQYMLLLTYGIDNGSGVCNQYTIDIDAFNLVSRSSKEKCSPVDNLGVTWVQLESTLSFNQGAGLTPEQIIYIGVPEDLPTKAKTIPEAIRELLDVPPGSGLSAYEVYLKTTTDNPPLTEEQYIMAPVSAHEISESLQDELVESKKKIAAHINAVYNDEVCDYTDSFDKLATLVGNLPGTQQWQFVHRECQTSRDSVLGMDVNTGTVLEVYKDSNPQSPAFGQTFKKAVGVDYVACPLPDPSGVYGIKWKRCEGDTLVSFPMRVGDVGVWNAMPVHATFKPCRINILDNSVRYISEDLKTFKDDGSAVDLTLAKNPEGEYTYMVEFGDFWMRYENRMDDNPDYSRILTSRREISGGFYVPKQYIGMFRGDASGKSVMGAVWRNNSNADAYATLMKTMGNDWYVTHILQRTVILALFAMQFETWDTQSVFPNQQTGQYENGMGVPSSFDSRGCGFGLKGNYMYLFMENAFGYNIYQNSGEIVCGIVSGPDGYIYSLNDLSSFVVRPDDKAIAQRPGNVYLKEFTNPFFLIGNTGGSTTTGKFDNQYWSNNNAVWYYGGGITVSGAGCGGASVHAYYGSSHSATAFAFRPARIPNAIVANPLPL